MVWFISTTKHTRRARGKQLRPQFSSALHDSTVKKHLLFEALIAPSLPRTPRPGSSSSGPCSAPAQQRFSGDLAGFMMQEELEEMMISLPVFVEKLVALQGAERLCEDSGVKNVDAATGVGLNEALRSSRRKIVTAKRPLRKSGCAGSTAGRSRISNCFYQQRAAQGRGGRA